MIAIDFETYLISNEHPAPKPVCLSWAKGEHSGIWAGHRHLSIALEKILEEDMIIAHNAKFEQLVIHEWFPEHREALWKSIEEGRWFCTKLYEQLLDNVRKGKDKSYMYSLDRLVKRYFEEDISADKTDPDAWRLRYAELDGVELEEWPQKAIDYAIGDSVCAYKIWERQQNEV